MESLVEGLATHVNYGCALIFWRNVMPLVVSNMALSFLMVEVAWQHGKAWSITKPLFRTG